MKIKSSSKILLWYLEFKLVYSKDIFIFLILYIYAYIWKNFSESCLGTPSIVVFSWGSLENRAWYFVCEIYVYTNLGVEQ